MKFLKTDSTLTDRYQTTIPAAIREFLGLEKKDKLTYEVQDGIVVLSRTEEDDPMIGKFLEFIEKDITENPTCLETPDPELLNEIASLTEGIDAEDIDLDAPISDI